MQHSKFDRRQVLKGALLAAAGAQVLRPSTSHAGLPQLSEADPTAKALGYHADAKTVDTKAFPSFKPGQRCETCQQLQPGTGPQRVCNLFSGKTVSVNGWCRVWVAKS